MTSLSDFFHRMKWFGEVPQRLSPKGDDFRSYLLYHTQLSLSNPLTSRVVVFSFLRHESWVSSISSVMNYDKNALLKCAKEEPSKVFAHVLTLQRNMINLQRVSRDVGNNLGAPLFWTGLDSYAYKCNTGTRTRGRVSTTSGTTKTVPKKIQQEIISRGDKRPTTWSHARLDQWGHLSIQGHHRSLLPPRVDRVEYAAYLWRPNDGTVQIFVAFLSQP